MSNTITLKMKNHSQSGWLMWALIMMPFGFGLLNELLGLPWAIKYMLDVAWVLLMVLCALNEKFTCTRHITNTFLWSIGFAVYTVLVYLVEFQSPLYYLWGFRNNFRFYAAFIAFCSFLKPNDIKDYLKVFDWLFWVNTGVSLIQYFGFELSGDFLGGIFGAESGSNAFTNLYFLIVICKSVVFCMEKKESLFRCLLKCAASLVVATLAEMKFYFVELLLVVMLAVLFTSFSWRKLWIILGALAAVTLCAAMLASLFPNFSGWFSVEWFLETALSQKGYTGSNDLNRLNAIPQINELWLKNWGQRLFGLGLGNCDTSGFAIVNTPFFERYGDMHYTWLSYAMIYLETGYIGLAFYFGFFVLVYRAIRKMEKKMDGVALSYCRISRIMCILCAVISVYNASLRAEPGYMAYFVLAIPFALYRDIVESGE